MARRFSQALDANPAPAALGDVKLRFEPSMLIAETPRQRLSLRPTIAWLLGLCFLMGALGGLVTDTSVNVALACIVLAGLSMAAATRLERLEKRQRRFVANFETYTLRLDFSSPFVGQPRTLNVAFDDVREVSVLEQADGALCLVVEFAQGDRVLQEVLVAFVANERRDELERFQRTLQNAFGLGEPPADSPAFSEESSFEP